MKRNLNEPVFLYISASVVQTWTLDEYRRCLAVDDGWSRWLNKGPFGLQVVAPGETEATGFTVVSRPLPGSATVDGVVFEKRRATLQPLGYDAVRWADNGGYPRPVEFEYWVPDLDVMLDLDLVPYQWVDGELVITLQFPAN
jgi:hypothetical protein